ncbi:MAG TPA: thiamine pyrophosphate-dependent enzyme [Acidobacteriaceae bacterium]
MSKKPAAHENPLIPNARLKQMYRAILRAHLLGQALPPAQRALTAGREAALVSTSIDLTSRDLVLDAVAGPVLDFLRGAPLHSALRARSKSSARVFADCGTPSRLAAIADPATRIQAAVGAAAALKSSALLARKDAKQSENAHDSAVVLSISVSGEVPADIWKSALSHSAQHDLPIIFLVLPAQVTTRTARRSLKTPDLRAIAYRAGVPAIPVDAADPVALYRVAQESIGHARIGGGPALIECVAFPAAASRKSTAVAHIEQYILERGIASQRWIDGESVAFAKKLHQTKHASK